MERHECFFVKRREIGQKKTGKICFLQMRLWLLYKVLVRFRHGGKSDKKHFPHLICCEDIEIYVKYIDIFLNYLIPSLTWYFGNDTEIFQQDNASWHALRIVMEYLDKNDIFTLYWPPQSPDLNIIGNIWHMITRKLHKNTKFIKSEQNIIGYFLA